MEAALKALAEPNRRTILRLVSKREMSVGAIASHFELSGPAISQHLKVLKEAGLVQERRDGNRRLYALRSAGLIDVRRFVESFWTDGLEHLKVAAEVEQKRRRGSARGG